MKIKFDLKSAFYALALGILAMLAIAASQPAHPMVRYQTAAGAGFFIIVDSSTGQAWGVNVGAQNFGAHPGFWESKVDR